ncbi:MAG: hypothetical protein BZ138_04515 [Methanosphaera sp. rholeuAM270]|nr:MAG: hypothetical protein BZ138_04515 [Methanosphaera sp. rholeuAM270]
MKKNRTKKTLKVNEENDIDSIIEIFQRFGKKYNIITTTLDSNIQYQTKNMKITQTYTRTILKKNINTMIRELKNKGKITLIVIDNLENKNGEVEDKIKKIEKMKNVEIRKIKEKDTFKALDEIIGGGMN